MSFITGSTLVGYLRFVSVINFTYDSLTIKFCKLSYVNLLSVCLSAEENGFNPVWNEGCEFELLNPDLALLRFCVQDEDVFGDPNFIGQFVVPISCIKTGYSAIPLKNIYNEELELCSLLVHVDIRNLYEEDKELYSTVM